MTRKGLRTLANVAALAVGLGFALFGQDMVLTNRGAPRDGTALGIPLPWFGYFVAGIGVLGFCGVNVYKGGPLDKANDPPDEAE
jgi:hypothetical protein